jgi:hypothetical protein
MGFLGGALAGHRHAWLGLNLERLILGTLKRKAIQTHQFA